MAQGKAINKNSFYGGNEMGSVPDIAMPSYDEMPPVANVAPDPWINSHNEQQSNVSAIAPVPDFVPEYNKEEQSTQQEEEIAPEVTIAKSKSPQESFKEIRAAKERAERERDALMSQMLEMQARLQFANQSVVQPQKQYDIDDVDFDIDIEEDSLAEGKHVKKVAQELKQIKKALKQYQTTYQETAVEAKIRSQYPDFEQVVSPENVEMLNAQYPEVAQALRNNHDVYSKAASAYNIIKKFGIYQNPIVSPERAQALKNIQKPRPLASVNPQQGDSPISKANAFANGLTNELKEQLRREMWESRKSH